MWVWLNTKHLQCYLSENITVPIFAYWCIHVINDTSLSCTNDKLLFIVIGDSGSVFNWYWIDTKYCVIAHPYWKQYFTFADNISVGFSLKYFYFSKSSSHFLLRHRSAGRFKTTDVRCCHWPAVHLQGRFPLSSSCEQRNSRDETRRARWSQRV